MVRDPNPERNFTSCLYERRRISSSTIANNRPIPIDDWYEELDDPFEEKTRLQINSIRVTATALIAILIGLMAAQGKLTFPTNKSESRHEEKDHTQTKEPSEKAPFKTIQTLER